VRRLLAEPQGIAQLFLGVAIGVGFAWGLPGSHSWAGDSVSPRSCGLGAIVETYSQGHFHTYPPLQIALLTGLSVPWMALAAIRVGTGIDALAAELIRPEYMTAIEVSARLLTAAMAFGVVGALSCLWSRIAGREAGWVAAAVTVTNAAFVYYAHTGNLEVPYLFWVSWALVEMDRVMAGEPREMRALLCCVAAALTKDQAAAALLLPVAWALAIVPWYARRDSPLRPASLRAAAVAVGVFALVSGAVTNPHGYRRRIAFLLGPASQSWAAYPKTVPGLLALARDAFFMVPHFTSWPIAIASMVGLAVVLAGARGRGLAGMRELLPLSAAVSFSLFFTLGARRTEDRFLLPQALFLLPYAARLLAWPWARWPVVRAIAIAGAALGAAIAVLGVASIDATLLADPRYEAERFLRELPPGTHVEVYGGPIFLPRIPPQLAAVRPGIEPPSERQRIPGVDELVDPKMDPRPRAPAFIVLATELSNELSTEPPEASLPFALAQYRDSRSHTLFRALADGSYGYARILRAGCRLPWPLSCRTIHSSTAGEVWIYAPAADPWLVKNRG
jgi:hypothetical protein